MHSAHRRGMWRRRSCQDNFLSPSLFQRRSQQLETDRSESTSLTLLSGRKMATNCRSTIASVRDVSHLTYSSSQCHIQTVIRRARTCVATIGSINHTTAPPDSVVKGRPAVQCVAREHFLHTQSDKVSHMLVSGTGCPLAL